MQKWLLNLIIVVSCFLGIQMISEELEQKFYFEDITAPQSGSSSKMENEQKSAISSERVKETVMKEETNQPPKTETSLEVKTPSKDDTMVMALNAMDLTGLQTLKGIGPVTAQRILDFKTAHGDFKTLDQLLDVKGIGPKKLESIKVSLAAL